MKAPALTMVIVITEFVAIFVIALTASATSRAEGVSRRRSDARRPVR